MSMDEEETRLVRSMFVELLREIGKLKAAELAWIRIAVEVLPHLPPEIEAILRRQQDYADDFQQRALLELERRFPGLAAELDADPPECQKNGGEIPPGS